MPRPSHREHLLDCAEELFAEHGVNGVSMRSIQAAAGLSVGSLRYHFKTQEDLVAAVMERRIEPLMARHEMLLEAVAENPDPSTDEVLGALTRPLVELLHAEPERAADLAAPDLESYADELVDYLSGALEAPQAHRRRKAGTN